MRFTEGKSLITVYSWSISVVLSIIAINGNFFMENNEIKPLQNLQKKCLFCSLEQNGWRQKSNLDHAWSFTCKTADKKTLTGTHLFRPKTFAPILKIKIWCPLFLALGPKKYAMSL